MSRARAGRGASFDERRARRCSSKRWLECPTASRLYVGALRRRGRRSGRRGACRTPRAGPDCAAADAIRVAARTLPWLSKERGADLSMPVVVTVLSWGGRGLSLEETPPIWRGGRVLLDRFLQGLLVSYKGR